MKSHYTCKELAAMQLPGLPTSERNMREKANRESWAGRKREGRGGGMEYQPSSSVIKLIRDIELRKNLTEFPAIKSAEIVIHRDIPSEQASDIIKVGGLVRRVKDDSGLTDKDRARRDAAILLCKAIHGAATAADCSIKRAITELAPRILNHTAHPELIEAAQVTYTKPRASGQSIEALISRLQKMYAAYEKGRMAGDISMYLVPGSRQPEGHSPLLIKAFLLHFCQPGRPPVTEAWRNSAPWFAYHGLERPAVDTFYRIEKELPVTIKYRGRVTGSEWRSLLPYVARDVSMFKANDIWVGDGHSFKAKVQHPLHGQAFVPEITFIRCWVSRKIVGWSIDLSESTVAVSAALRHSMMNTRARPLVYYSDNGSGQTGKLIDCPVHGTLARLGIAHETGIPGNPQGRGIIERLWADTLIPLARSYPTCIWRGGDKESTRKMLVELNKKETRVLLPSFEQLLDDVARVVDEYNSTPHGALDKATPDEFYEANIDQDSIDLGITPHELASMWLPERPRTPQRGIVSLFNNEYAFPDLVNIMPEGEQVRVRFDIHNPHQVWLYRMDGRYIGEAKWDGHKRSAFPISYMDQLREKRAEGKVKRGERIINEAYAELGNTVDGEVLQPFDFPSVERAPELVPVEVIAAEATQDELGSYEDTVRWLYGNNNQDIGEHPGKEVAAS